MTQLVVQLQPEYCQEWFPPSLCALQNVSFCDGVHLLHSQLWGLVELGFVLQLGPMLLCPHHAPHHQQWPICSTKQTLNQTFDMSHVSLGYEYMDYVWQKGLEPKWLRIISRHLPGSASSSTLANPGVGEEAGGGPLAT